MVDGSNNFDPFNTHPSDWCLTEMGVLIGESPGWTDKSLKGTITVPNQFYLGRQQGYMGVMPWSDSYTDRSISANILEGLKCQRNWESCKPDFSFLE